MGLLSTFDQLTNSLSTGWKNELLNDGNVLIFEQVDWNLKDKNLHTSKT